jgi:hypothetical protein
MECHLQNSLEQSKTKTFPVDFTKTDGSLTNDINETITYTLDYLIPKDDEDNDSDYQKTIRTQIGKPIQTADDREYTPEEIGLAIEAINRKKSTRRRRNHQQHITTRL